MGNNTLLSVYSDILLVQGIEKYKKSFISNKTLRDFGYHYIQEYDYFMKDEMIEDNGFNPIFEIDIIKKDDFFEKLLDLVNTSLFKGFIERFSKLKNRGKKQKLLTAIYDELETLLKKTYTFTEEETIIIENKLKEIVIFLKGKYHSLIEYHNVFRFLIEESDLFYFRNKDLDNQFYTKLYELAYELYLIDDTETEEYMFIEAFISPTPQILPNKIRFITKNNLIAYFLKSLKPFFDNFTYEAIEKSGVFLNKQNKPIKVTDINTALSRGKDKDLQEKSKIDKRIKILIKDYLK
ncbi:MAG: hypothetical protein KGV44_01075 [Flavobacteriaceae bacterium]|nr:hypothetical protein [Flavobacteriaceae bacterium]